MTGQDIISVQTEDKGRVKVHTCQVPYPIEATLVCLDMVHGEERRFRTRVGDGAEGRITVSKQPHYQEEKLHPGPGLYLLQRGWIAILTPAHESYKVDVAFARSADRFHVIAPGNTWYAAFLSGPIAYTYAASDNATGKVRQYNRPMPSEEEILRLFAEQHGLSDEQVKSLVEGSM